MSQVTDRQKHHEIIRPKGRKKHQRPAGQISKTDSMYSV